MFQSYFTQQLFDNLAPKYWLSQILSLGLANRWRRKAIQKAGLEEGTTALTKGAFVTQFNLICKINEDEYKFTIRGESLNLTGLKTPKTQLSKNEEEMEGLVLEKSSFCFIIFVIDLQIVSLKLLLRSLDQELSFRQVFYIH